MFKEKIKQKNKTMFIEAKGLKLENLQEAPQNIHYRLSVAAGLSYPVGDWPEQILPSKVSNWQQKETIRIPDRDEQYAK